jgi:effector-binding domain-containing protein
MTGPKLEERNASSLAYIVHKGPYDKIPWQEFIEKLYGWAKEQKVMPGFYPMAIYPDDPKTVPPEECRTEIAITFKGKAKEGSGVKIRQMPAMKVATVSHKGPGGEFQKTYGMLMEWMEKKCLELSGPPMEIYSKKPEVVGGETIIYAKIMMPVKKSNSSTVTNNNTRVIAQ